MNAQAAMQGGAGDAPTVMDFGAEITVVAEGGKTNTFREVHLEMESTGVLDEDDAYRVEYMGIRAGGIWLERNEDGTWGDEHESARAAGERLAGWLIRDAVLSVEVAD